MCLTSSSTQVGGWNRMNDIQTKKLGANRCDIEVKKRAVGLWFNSVSELKTRKVPSPNNHRLSARHVPERNESRWTCPNPMFEVSADHTTGEIVLHRHRPDHESSEKFPKVVISGHTRICRLSNDQIEHTQISHVVCIYRPFLLTPIERVLASQKEQNQFTLLELFISWWDRLRRYYWQS